MDKVLGLIDSVEDTAANVHKLTPSANLLDGRGTVDYAGNQGIEKRPEMNGNCIGSHVAMRQAKRQTLLVTPEGQLDDLVETAKAHIRAKSEHPFRMTTQPFRFQWSRRGASSRTASS